MGWKRPTAASAWDFARPTSPKCSAPSSRRLIFPIHTTGGQVAGFAGRSLTPSEKGRKYAQLPRQSCLPQGAYPLRPAQGGEGRSLRGANPALRGIQGRARLPRLRHTVRRGAMRHGAHRGAYPGDTEAGRAGDALSRSRSGGTAEHGPVRPYAPVRGMRRQPASPARRHGPGRGVPPERERRAGTPSTGGYPRLPLLPHPPSGFPPSHGHRRHQRDVGRDRPPLLPAGRVPKDRGAIRSDGNTDRGTTAGNLRRHRPEKRTGTGAEEGSRRLTPALPRERTLLRFCLTHHDRMFYDPDGNGISLPAWVSGELADNELPLEDPEHARLLHLLAEGKHPDGIADERLSALVLSLRRLRAARYRAGTGRTASRRDPLPSAPLRRVLRAPEASPGLGVRPHGGDTRRAPAPTSHARESLRPKRPYRQGIAKPKYPAGGDIGGRQKKLPCLAPNTIVPGSQHSSIRSQTQ